MVYRISVDTGGTFTDVVVAAADGSLTIGKAMTTPDRPFQGIASALDMAAEQLGLDRATLLANTAVFLYGTTRATNAIVEGRTARTALLVTQGFPDILVLKEGGKPNPHQLDVDYPEPYIPRRLTFEIPERIGADGEVVRPVRRRRRRVAWSGDWRPSSSMRWRYASSGRWSTRLTSSAWARCWPSFCRTCRSPCRTV